MLREEAGWYCKSSARDASGANDASRLGNRPKRSIPERANAGTDTHKRGAHVGSPEKNCELRLARGVPPQGVRSFHLFSHGAYLSGARLVVLRSLAAPARTLVPRLAIPAKNGPTYTVSGELNGRRQGT